MLGYWNHWYWYVPALSVCAYDIVTNCTGWCYFFFILLDAVNFVTYPWNWYHTNTTPFWWKYDMGYVNPSWNPDYSASNTFSWSYNLCLNPMSLIRISLVLLHNIFLFVAKILWLMIEMAFNMEKIIMDHIFGSRLVRVTLSRPVIWIIKSLES